MRFGKINLFCPICGEVFRYNDQKLPARPYHHSTFGILCSEACHEKAELKYVRMVMGKDDV